MNDVLFAHLFKASHFGNEKVNFDNEFGIAINLGEKTALTTAKAQAEAQQLLEHRYMLVVRNHAQVTIQKRVTSLPYWASIRII
jgi:hypothetical protein